MCDQHYEEDLDNYLRKTGLTRRRFGALGVAMGLMAVLPRAANALDVIESDVEVRTPDGVADCYFVHPASGAHAGVLLWPDALGLRPAFRRMGRRLAESGYAVLVVNPYYRKQRAPVIPDGATFADKHPKAWQAISDVLAERVKGEPPFAFVLCEPKGKGRRR